MQTDEEDADADRVQQMFEDAFKGQLWAGGRCPNAMVELQRAILDGVLDLRSIEAHRLVCLSSDSQHFKGLRRGVLRAFWDLKAENGVFFRTEVFLDSIFSFLLIFLSNAFSWLHEILQEGSSRGKVSYRVSFRINPCAE